MSKVRKQPPSLETSEERIAWLKTLSPDELEALRSQVTDKLLKGYKIDVNGKQVPFRAFRDRYLKQQEEFERGVYDESVRTIPRWQAKEMIPSSRARPGATKQMLRKEDEDQLQLDKLGNGNVFSPRKVLGKFLKGERDFAFGIFARPDNIASVFGRRWAGRDPNRILSDPKFYDDIINRCHDIELTLMVYPVRPLPLSQIQPAMKSLLEKGAERLSGGDLQEKDKADIDKFVTLFDESRVQHAGWVDKGKIKPGTHLIVAAAPNGGLAVEAITPGTISQRKTSYIGISKNGLVAKAAFDAFLGPQPLDDYGKLCVGHGALWCANGLRLYDADQPGVHEAVDDPKGDSLKFVVNGDTLPQGTTSIFKIDTSERMLLNSIRKKKPLDKIMYYA